jgi:hypothetical protein
MKYGRYCTLSDIILPASAPSFRALKMGFAALILSYAQAWRLSVTAITLRRD